MRTNTININSTFSSLFSTLPVLLLAVVLAGCASKEMETFVDRDTTAMEGGSV